MTEPVYEVALAPGCGDGRLSMADVHRALTGVPQGATVDVRVSDCDAYDPSAPGELARWLCGSSARLVFAASAHRVADGWTAAFDRAAAEYLAVEARLLGRGA